MASQICQVYNVEACFTSGTRHFAIYVAIDNGPGQLLHVRCAVGKAGMMFERQYFVGHGPEALSTFVTKVPIGSVRMEDLDRLADICGAIGAPTAQYVNNACQCATWVHQAQLAAMGADLLKIAAAFLVFPRRILAELTTKGEWLVMRRPATTVELRIATIQQTQTSFRSQIPQSLDSKTNDYQAHSKMKPTTKEGRRKLDRLIKENKTHPRVLEFLTHPVNVANDTRTILDTRYDPNLQSADRTGPCNEAIIPINQALDLMNLTQKDRLEAYEILRWKFRCSSSDPDTNLICCQEKRRPGSSDHSPSFMSSRATDTRES
ncbi:hypothetical protein TrVGV298_006508 [Trichoderma virens]|nr:hypothetical protein TrVGV298_006508 [Trichoderma virens]